MVDLILAVNLLNECLPGGIDGFLDLLKGQVGIVFANDEVTVIAKELVKFSEDNDKLRVVSGFFEN